MTTDVATRGARSTEGDARPARTARYLPGPRSIVGPLAAIGVLYAISRENYLLFHVLVELFGIVISFAIFLFAWNSRRLVQNSYLTTVGVVYASAGAVDLLHALTYRGMNVIPGYDANLPTQLWVIARAIEAIGLLQAALWLRGGRVQPAGRLLALYGGAAIVLVALAFEGRFPDCLLPDSGLTPFKIASEYVAAILVIGAVAILRSAPARDRLGESVVVTLVAAGLVSVAAKLAFTLYADPYGLMNAVGHILRVAANYLVYRAIIEIGINEPFSIVGRDLRDANARLTETLRTLDRRHREVTRLHDLHRALQAATNERDTHEVIVGSASEFFPETSGALYVTSDGAGKSVETATRVATWGDDPPLNQAISCRFLLDRWTAGGDVSPTESERPGGETRLPLVYRESAVGCLVIRESADRPVSDESASTTPTTPTTKVGRAFAEDVALALLNIKLIETLARQATLDPLTGLFNRRYMEDAIGREIARADRHGTALSLAVIDIDHFKEVNDRYGHETGDTLLREIGASLRRYVRASDVVCRLGGDEFVIVLPDAPRGMVESRLSELRARTRGLAAANGLTGEITLSAGVAVYPEHGTTADALMRVADRALYQAKANGRDRCEIADPVDGATSGASIPE